MHEDIEQWIGQCYKQEVDWYAGIDLIEVYLCASPL